MTMTTTIHLERDDAVALLEARGWSVDPRPGYGATDLTRQHYWHLDEALTLALRAEAQRSRDMPDPRTITMPLLCIDFVREEIGQAQREAADAELEDDGFLAKEALDALDAAARPAPPDAPAGGES
jgi:hypothetical protein